MAQPASSPVADESRADEIRATVHEMIMELAPEPGAEHGPDTALVEDLGYHSLAVIELAFALEDEFDLEPVDETMAKEITTIGKIQELVVTRVLQRENAR